MTTPRSRHAARLRASRRRAQARARWFVLAVAVTVLAVVTLAVTAFGNDRSSSSPLAGAPASAPVTSAPPEPQVLATVGNLRIESPVVTLDNVSPDPALSVGANVAAGSSKLGSVVNVASVEKQALAAYAPDRGNNVAIEVFPSATLDDVP